MTYVVITGRHGGRHVSVVDADSGGEAIRMVPHDPWTIIEVLPVTSMNLPSVHQDGYDDAMNELQDKLDALATELINLAPPGEAEYVAEAMAAKLRAVTRP